MAAAAAVQEGFEAVRQQGEALRRRDAAAGDIGRIALWDVTDAARPVLVRELVPAHRDHATIVAFRPSGHILASGGADRAIRLWDATDPAHLVPVGKPIAAFCRASRPWRSAPTAAEDIPFKPPCG